MVAAWLVYLALAAAPAWAQSILIPVAPRGAATEVVLHGRIHTMDSRQPLAEAMAILGGRIVAVGSDAEIQPWIGPATRVIDAGGRLVLPGFNDDHVHFLDGSTGLAMMDLRDAATPAEFVRRICQQAKQMKPGEWITQGNWDETLWTPPRLPTRQMIDACTPRNPVYVSRHDGHMGLANTLALHLARITAQTPTPPGGVIVKDASGQPTGALKDNAQDLVERIIPLPSDQEMERFLAAGLRQAAGVGLTTLQDMALDPPYLPRVYQKMLAQGRLTARIYVRQPLADWRNLAALGIRAGFGGPWIWLGSTKAFADGSLGSETAYFFAPYSDRQDGWRGLPMPEMNPPSVMQALVEHADQAGLQVCIHAIGDEANSEVLDIFQHVETADGRRDRRFRIEHAQHVAPQDFARFGRLHVIASVQPYHAIDDGRFLEARIGSRRAAGSYAFRTFLNHGVRLAFGTDWPVAPLDPLLGIYGAVTRETLDGKYPHGWFPEQKLSVQEAVYAYTMGSAYAAFQDQVLGSLTPGKYADYVILDRDIFSIPPDEIKAARIYKTVVGGRVVYTAGDFPVNIEK
ncbi:MAG: amidohydrolase [Terriglobales bacterium]